MGEGDRKVLFPDGVLGVGNDPRASDGGSGEADGDVRVAGDDIVVRVVRRATRKRLSASREEAAETLGDHIHVGQTPRF